MEEELLRTVAVGLKARHVPSIEMGVRLFDEMAERCRSDPESMGELLFAMIPILKEEAYDGPPA